MRSPVTLDELDHAEVDAERRVIRSPEVFLDAIENMVDGFVLFDRDGRFVLCNKVYRRIYPEVAELLVPGTSFDEIIRAYSAHPSEGRLRPEDQAAFHRERMAAWRSSRPMVETTPGGRLIETRDQATVSGHRIGIRIDVTERLRAEHALRESEERFRALVLNAPLGIQELSLGELLAMNPAGLSITGVEHESEIVGRRYLDGVADCDRERVAALLDRVVTGEPSQFEFTAAGDEPREFSSSFIPIKSESGEVVRVMGVTQDVTDAKRAQADLSEKTAILEATLENMEQGISMVDASLRGVAFNQRFLDLLDFPPDLFSLGDPFEKFVRYNAQRGEYGEGDIEELVRERVELARRFEPHRMRRTRPDGTVLEIRGNPIPGGGFVTTYTDVTETHRLSEQLTHQATHDALTGLVNRWEFERRLRRVLESPIGADDKHALCYLDLDQFKVINDTCGHSAGDELLRRLAAILAEQVRKRDTFARLGGDEFGVIMEHCTLEQAERVANKLCTAVDGFQFVWEDKIFKVGVSIGLVPITGAANVGEIMSAADTACYVAKDRGRSRIYVYRPDDADLAQHHGEMEWVARINRALEEDRFQLYFQKIEPVVDSDAVSRQEPDRHRGDGSSRDGLHYEILLRMEDENGRLIPPGAFLPAAERFNLATRIDRWVINATMTWLGRHPAHLDRLSTCCINLSGQSVSDEGLIEFLIARLGPVRPDQLCFEITETAAVGNVPGAKRLIKTLKDEGCRFALDDFGSGVSSFGYLKTLPVDYLKIDGVFVQGVATDPIDLAMVRSINEIGHIMGKQTIAEFVDNRDVFANLREIGIDYAQGYAIHRPESLNRVLD